MQVDDVRHHGRAEDADGQQHAVGAVEARDQPGGELARVDADLQQVVHEAEEDDAEEAGDRELEAAVAARLQLEDREGHDRGHQAGRERRHAEEQVERDRRADELGQVGRDRDRLGLQPQPEGDGLLEVLAAQLRQVLAGGDAGLGRQVLHEHRHQVRGDDHPQQHVAVLGAARDVGGEVAGVDVGDGGDEGRAEQRDPPADAPARAGLAAARECGGSGARRWRRARPRSASADSRARTRIEVASWPPSACVSPVDLDEQRAAERLLVDHPQRACRARSRARPGSAGSRGRRRRCARRSPPRPARATTGTRSAPRRSRGRRTGSGRRAGRASDGRAWPRSAPRARRRARARAPRPPGARGPTARRATRPGRARAAGGGGPSPAPAACRPRSAGRRGSARG